MVVVLRPSASIGFLKIQLYIGHGKGQIPGFTFRQRNIFFDQVLSLKAEVYQRLIFGSPFLDEDILTRPGNGSIFETNVEGIVSD